MRIGRTLIAAFLFYAAHFVATVTLMLESFGNAVAFSDTSPLPEPSSRYVEAVEAAVSILRFPASLLPYGVAQELGWLPLLLNSLLWTAVLIAGIRYSRAHLRRFGPRLPNTR